MKKTDLLIVIDAQNGFVNERSRHVLPAIGRAIELARADGVPIVFTRFINEEGSAWETLIGWRRLRTRPETDLHKDVAAYAEPDEIIDKNTYTSLVGKVQELVSRSDVHTVALCGIATDGCVLKTAVDLFEAGMRPIVLTDAVASHAGAEVHEAGLLLIARFIGSEQLMSSDDWFESGVPAVS